jgi:hypothetical protein
MTERMTRREAWAYFEGTLANAEVAEKGHVACIDTTSGEIVASQEATGLRPIGYFEENKTGTGSNAVRVKLFREVWVDRLANAGTNPVTASDVGSVCYLVDSETVSISHATNTRSAAGIVWAVTSAGVLVEMGAS